MAQHNARRKIEDTLISELERTDSDDPTANMPQQEMNQYALRRAEEMDAKLDLAIAKLQDFMNRKEQQRFARTQRAWRVYRDAQAELASLTFEGGSMQPFIRYGEQSRLTIERVAALQSEYDFRSKATVPFYEQSKRVAVGRRA
jgi:uncharacterized protein YecT (DUF1311 family)